MVFAGLSYPERWYTEGLKVMTTTYPIKPPLYAITKTTNYLPNVLMQMEAKEAGRRQRRVHRRQRARRRELEHERGVRDRRRRAAPPEVRPHPAGVHVAAAAGAGARRWCDAACCTGVEVGDIPVADARAAREMLLHRQLGEGRADRRSGTGSRSATAGPGRSPRRCSTLIDEDMRTSDRLIDVPYEA